MKSKIRFFLSVIVAICILMNLCVGTAEVQVFTHIEAKGTSFNPGDSFSVYVVPVNTDTKYLSNLNVNLSLPNNLLVTDKILPDKPDQLGPFEAKIFEYVVRNASPLNVSLPRTGDKGLPGGLWIFLCAVAVFFLLKLYHAKKGRIIFKSGTSLFLVLEKVPLIGLISSRSANISALNFLLSSVPESLLMIR